MSKVIVDMGMSLEGFAAGPNVDPHNNLGDGARVFERIDPKDIELEVARGFDSPEVTHLAYRLGKERTE